MSDKFKNSKFYQTLKDPKVSRALYISLVVILVITAIVIGAVSAANRAKNNTGKVPSKDPNPSGTTENKDTGTTENKPDDGTKVPLPGTKPTGNEVPELSLPVSGKVIKQHDAKVQVFSLTMNDYRVHLGVDIATEEGAAVLAAADGKVRKIWKDPMMGYCLALEHSGDTVTVYKNLSDSLPEGIKEGVTVKAGDKIAHVGDSALLEVAEEPHLHFEVTVKDIQTDPLTCFSEKDLKALTVDTAYED